MSGSNCPLEEGDRIDHKLFGFGTVVGAPIPMVGPDLRSSSGVRDAGWSVPVKWTIRCGPPEPSCITRCVKVSSPDSRPFSHWDRQWLTLLQAWLAARRDVEQLPSSFRSVPEPGAFAHV